ncbi:hypothetical protein P3X46_009121 [Hevea brasiliensis]|uniref:VQ domain-containing protein n=1 Tax=Hevea brasiliensis TaxID=3981 RepID=A0ABQ9MKZ4_HEVBR|nr:calmodulin-binding protein 25-like [Hevea brasiliensis]KAJ9180937.1 hypothetical protein P3X46_009121 [Hevea brasiliensis]
MASSENLASFEPFLFRPTFTDSWIAEAYARDTDALTKALQKTFSNDINSTSSFSISETLSPDFLVNLVSGSQTPPPATPTASNFSGSDPETAAPKRQRNGIGILGAPFKVSKRKSRATKRSQTTFITADPASFRQMVQQVTGVRFGNAQMPAIPVLKPEPQRPGNRLNGAGGCLPTLDTSAFMLDHHHEEQQQTIVGSGSGSGSGSVSAPVNGSGTVSFPQPVVSDGGPHAALDFDTYSSFPTLESCLSWN